MTSVNDEYRVMYNSFNEHTVNLIETDDNPSLGIQSEANDVDLSNKFPNINGKWHKGISSSCAIASTLSYFLKRDHNISKEFSPYFLAFQQFFATKSWENIDIYTGLDVVRSIGLCSNYLVGDTLQMNTINNPSILNDAKNYKIKTLHKVNLSIDNIMMLLTNGIPIITSVQIIPHLNIYPHENDIFYNYFDKDEYWKVVEKYYQSNDNIYAVSFVIVGYNKDTKMVKVRGCWGNAIGDNGYFYISFDTVIQYNNLFFDSFIFKSCFPFIEKMNTCSLQFDGSGSYKEDTPTKKFPRIDSKSDVYGSQISISSFDDEYLNQNAVDIRLSSV